MCALYGDQSCCPPQVVDMSIEAKYYELIMAVDSKWPGESRHETALRYIRERESAVDTSSEKVVNGVSSA